MAFKFFPPYYKKIGSETFYCTFNIDKLKGKIGVYLIKNTVGEIVYVGKSTYESKSIYVGSDNAYAQAHRTKQKSKGVFGKGETQFTLDDLKAGIEKYPQRFYTTMYRHFEQWTTKKPNQRARVTYPSHKLDYKLCLFIFKPTIANIVRIYELERSLIWKYRNTVENPNVTPSEPEYFAKSMLLIKENSKAFIERQEYVLHEECPF